MYLGECKLKLGKILAPANHGGRRHPMAAIVPHPRCQGIQQSVDMLRNRSTLLKLEKIAFITNIFTIVCMTH
jgi:hypothetical protein